MSSSSVIKHKKPEKKEFNSDWGTLMHHKPHASSLVTKVKLAEIFRDYVPTNEEMKANQNARHRYEG